MSDRHHQQEIRAVRKQRQWDPRPAATRRYDRVPPGGQGLRPAGVTTLILFLGVAGELVVPWLVIWLSDTFVFDVPAWLIWISFGGPMAAGLLAMVAYWCIHLWRTAPAVTPFHAHQARH